MSLPSWNKAAFIEKASKGMFAARAARTDVYKNNCEIFKEGGYVTDSGETVSLDPSGMLERTFVYSEVLPVPEVKPLDASTATGVANRDCIGLGRELQERGYNPVILNLADAYMACGWYYKGSKAQEESLCRQSTLSMSLYQYYSQAHCDNSGIEFKKKLYPLDLNHGAIYSPEVTVFRKGPKDCYELMDKPYQTAFISCAALDFNEKHGKNLEYQTVDGGFTPEGRLIMLNKIRTIYTVALANGHDSMVLGAFGCGAFRLRPDLVAGMFRDVLCEPAFKDRFRLVCFAILEGDGDTGLHGKFAPFYKVFGSLNLSNPKASMIPAEEVPDFKEGQRVRHAKFGEGTVKSMDTDHGKITVDFDTVGEKTLALRVAKLDVI